MTGEQDWRIAADSETYFGQQQKATQLADRRPVARKPSDLGMGPGFSAAAIRITDYGDLLATYNGMFSAEPGVFGAPNPDEAFVGVVVNDASMGGTQTFTGLVSGATYTRTFQRNPADPESIFWGVWTLPGGGGLDVGFLAPFVAATPPSTAWLVCNGTTYDAEQYPDLYVALGNSNVLPDLRDRSVYGVGSAWSLLGTDGLSLSSRTKNLYHVHDLATDTAAAHTHSLLILDSGTHSHSASTGSPSGTQNVASGGVSAAGPGHTHSVSVGSDGYHSHGAGAATNGSHAHAGTTWDSSGSGPLLRGVGMYWMVRALP